MIRLMLTAGLLTAMMTFRAQADAGPMAMPTCNISQSQWESPDRSRTLLADPALRRLLQAWASHPSNRLSIEYPGGEQGDIWAHRLVAWLVAFGVSRHEISLFPGGSDMNTLSLSLQSDGSGA